MEDSLKIPLKKEFNKWLCENFTEGSSKSYMSYVNSSLKLINEKVPKNNVIKMINEYVSKKDTMCVEFFLENCISYVIKYCGDNVRNKFKNGLLQYKFFLTEILTEDELVYSSEYEIILEDQKSETLRLKDEDLLFDNDTLKKNFIFRLLTQDRIYGEIYFPISVIKKLLYKHNETQFFDSWIENQINNIKFYTNNSEIILFENVKSLSISTSKEVIFYTNEGKYILYTQNGYTKETEPLKTFALRNIAIDHVKPMKEILSDEKENLKALAKITKLLNETKLLTGSGKELLKNVKKAGNLLIETNSIDNNDIISLKKDLEYLSRQIDLKLMCSKENLKKNKSFNV